MHKDKGIQILWDFLLWFFLVGLDQGTKYYASKQLKGKADVSFIPNVLEMHYLENKGAAFGILPDQNLFFLLIGIVAFLLCCYFLWKIPNKKKYHILQFFLVLMGAGTIGNMIDRGRLGYVVDFIYISTIHFPVFNLADIFVTISTVGLITLFLFVYKETDLGFIGLKTNKYREIDENNK